MRDLVGRTITERYEVVELLGSGGMSTVYKVWDRERAVYLAMKVLHEDMAHDKIFLRRFQREAQTLAKLQHPYIVRFYGLEQEGELVFLLMDYIEGTTLKKEIFNSKGPFPMERVLEIMQPVCSALTYAHNKGFIHCDIKPANIMVERTGRVLLTDFGIARLAEGATATMVGAGTPAYMAPDQILGRDPTPQTDIYALGIVLYEMLTGGERPFTGERATITGSTSEKVRWEQLKLQPAPIVELNRDIPQALVAIINRCLEKVPEKRFASAMQLLEALRQAFPNLDLAVPEPLPPLPDDEEQADRPPRGSHKLRVWVWGLFGLVGLLLVVVTVLVVKIGPLLAGGSSTATSAPEASHPGIVYQTVVVTPPETLDQPQQSQPVVVPDVSLSQVKLAYTIGDPGNSNVYLADGNGNSQVRIAYYGQYDEAEPSVSADGRSVYFQANYKGNYDIYMVNASGGNERAITSTTEYDEREPAISPDGQSLLYRLNPAGESRDVNGYFALSDLYGNRQILGGIQGREPVWAHDGSSFAYMSNMDGNWQIYVYDLNSGQNRQVTYCAVNCRFPDISPDDQYIIFNITDSPSSPDPDGLAYIPFNGGEMQILINGEGASRPAWTAAGWIAFNSGLTGIQLIDMDGNYGNLVVGNGAWSAAWSQ